MGDVMKSLKTLLSVLALMGASQASAEEDTFFLGNGKAGNYSVQGTTAVPVNTYTKVKDPISKGDSAISVENTNNFKDNDGTPSRNGELVMVIQMMGTDLGSDNPVNLESSADGKVGRWEFARLASPCINKDGKLSLEKPLIHEYDENLTQVITVPEYESFYIPSGKIVSAKAWNGFTGGVLVFLVRGTLINEGKISADEAGVVDGVGFRGGREGPPGNVVCDVINLPAGNRGEGLDEGALNVNVRGNSANAGGGGLCDRAGGGGGGNATRGGNGGHNGSAASSGGLGGFPASYNETLFPTRLILGGGGGGGGGQHGGAGGAGGGAIFIRAGSLLRTGTGTDSITADGVKGKESSSGGGGGGGAGGTIILRVAGVADCPTKLSAKGGNGGSIGSTVTGSNGPGGGGGSGRIFFQADGLNCSADVSPGAPGYRSGNPYGATPGETGNNFTHKPKALAHPGDAVVTSISPMKGGFVNVNTPTVKVRALAGRKVYLSFNDGGRTASLSESFSPDAGYSEYTYKETLVGNLKQDANTVVAFAEYEGLWSKGVPSSFDVDTIAPNTHIAKVLPEFTPPTTNSRWVQFTFRATKSDTSTTVESGATFECSLDGSAWSPCGEVTTYDDTLGDATTHTLQVRAVDPAGNEDGVPASFSWTFDWTPPGKAIVTEPSFSPAFLNDQRYTFRGTMEANTDVLVYIDDVLMATAMRDGSTTWSFRPAVGSELSPGPHRIRVAARDSAGNVGPLSDTVFFTVDIDKPGVTIEKPAAAFINTSLLLVNGTAEPGSIVTVKIWTKDKDTGAETEVKGAGGSVPTGAGGIPEAWNYGMTMTLDDGRYVVKASAVDAAGNTSQNPARHEFTLDRKPPNTKIVGCPKPFTNQNTESFSFGSDATDVSGYECALVGNSQTTPMTQCPTELVKTPTDPGAPSYPDGEYELIARAKDYADNVDPLPVACSWVWDQTPPDSLNLLFAVDGKSYPPPEVTNSELAVFYFTANDEHSGPVKYECLVEDVNPPGPVKSFGDCSNPYAVSVEKGTHRLKVRVMDQAGNLYEPPSGAVLPYEWTVDTGLPVARILPGKGAGDPTNAEEATFRFDLKVPISSGPVEYYYTLDPTIRSSAQAVSVGPDGDTVTITLPKEDGSYTLWALARDSRGIETPYELWDAYEWVVDRTAPKVEIVSKPKGQESSSTATFVFSAPEEETVGGFLCILNDCSSVGDSTQAQNCTGRKDGASASFTVHGLQAGSNCIQVWSQDLAGNLSMSSASYRWTIASQSPASVVGGGVGCTSSGSGGSLLALLGLVRLLYRGRERRRA
jgi:hypothetical protein